MVKGTRLGKKKKSKWHHLTQVMVITGVVLKVQKTSLKIPSRIIKLRENGKVQYNTRRKV